MESSEGKEKVHWQLSQCAIISEMVRMEWYVPFYFPTRISGFSVFMVSAPWLITIWNFLFRSNSTSCMNGTYSPGKSVQCFTCPAGHKCPTTDVSKIIAVKSSLSQFFSRWYSANPEIWLVPVVAVFSHLASSSRQYPSHDEWSIRSKFNQSLLAAF